MKTNLKTLSLLTFTLLALTNIASAHQIGGSGVMSGLTHPLFGLDHLFAMIAVGIVSTQIGQKSVWQLPMVFVSFMILGGLMGMEKINIPFIEMGIALSVLFLGIIMSFYKHVPITFVMSCVAVFAIFHGQAHGAEMPQIANPAFYIFGFIFSTTILHIAGILVGHYAKSTDLTLRLLRYSGVGVSLMGVWFLVGI